MEFEYEIKPDDYAAAAVLHAKLIRNPRKMMWGAPELALSLSKGLAVFARPGIERSRYAIHISQIRRDVGTRYFLDRVTSRKVISSAGLPVPYFQSENNVA